VNPRARADQGAWPCGGSVGHDLGMKSGAPLWVLNTCAAARWFGSLPKSLQKGREFPVSGFRESGPYERLKQAVWGEPLGWGAPSMRDFPVLSLQIRDSGHRDGFALACTHRHLVGGCGDFPSVLRQHPKNAAIPRGLGVEPRSFRTRDCLVRAWKGRWCMDRNAAAALPSDDVCYTAIARDSGLPSVIIRFRMLQAMIASASCDFG
jgi:hypothetical protein